MPQSVRLASAGTAPMLGQLNTATSSLGGPICSLPPDVAGPMPRPPLTASLPPKLTKRILDLEFIHMAELLPETWSMVDQQDKAGKCCQQVQRLPKRGLVKDILIWLECYSVMVAVLTTKYPAKAPELAAYQRTIIRAARNYEDEAWVTYDVCYRRNAAACKDLNWSRVDHALYSEVFTGRAKLIPRCRQCNSEHHNSVDCPLAPQELGGNPVRQSGHSLASGAADRRRGTVEICRLFNSPSGNQCRYRNCRYAHLCSNCRAPHAAQTCPRYQASTWGPRKHARSPSPPWVDRKAPWVVPRI